MRPARRARTRQWLIDTLDELHRKPTAGPTLPAEVAISAALTMFVPGPASLIGPKGIGVWLIQRALRQTGYSIVPTEAKRPE